MKKYEEIFLKLMKKSLLNKIVELEEKKNIDDSIEDLEV